MFFNEEHADAVDDDELDPSYPDRHDEMDDFLQRLKNPLRKLHICVYLSSLTAIVVHAFL